MEDTNTPTDLTEVIKDALDDATAVPEAELEAAPDLPTTPEAPAPEQAAKPPVEEDEFGPQFRESGRENKIPYSRVKAITENAKKKVVAEWETKVKDYTEKLSQYEPVVQKQQELDRIIFNEPEKFLGLLRQIPAYANLLSGGAAPAQAQSAPTQADLASMPQPDIQLQDGTKTYSMEGLQKLMDWNTARAVRETEQRVSQRFAPIERDYRAHQQLQAILPKVQAQIDEASKWPLFKESEDEITRALQNNPTWNLEKAYQSVVFPKLVPNKDKMRQDILAEINARPRSTATTATTPVSAQPDSAPKSTEDIIRSVLAANKR